MSKSSTTTSDNSSKTKGKMFENNEKVLCYHGSMIYPAKILDNNKVQDSECKYLIHYNGWSKKWDEIVSESRILKDNEENRRQMEELQKANTAVGKPGSKSKKVSTTTTPDDSAADSDSRPTTPVLIEETKLPPLSSSPRKTKSASSSRRGSKEIKTRQLPAIITTSNEENTMVTIDESPTQAPPITQSSGFKAEADWSWDELEEAKPEKRVLKEFEFPEPLKQILIDDYDLIVNQKMLHRLPARDEKSLEKILSDFMMHGQSESVSDPDLGIKYDFYQDGILTYFRFMIGRTLLYSSELNLHRMVLYNSNIENGMHVSRSYGLVHLLRLFTKLPEEFSKVTIEDEIIEAVEKFTIELFDFIVKNLDTYYNKEKDYYLPKPKEASVK